MTPTATNTKETKYEPFGAEWGLYLSKRHTKDFIIGLAAKMGAENEAMRLALLAITHGVARIERSGELQEFCFNGLRYTMNGNWRALIAAIGPRAIRDAVEKVC